MEFFKEGLKVFLLAMTPIGELRIAIPIGLIVYKLNPIVVYFFSVLGNLFAVFLIFIFFSFFSRWICKNIYFLKKFFNWLFSKTRKVHYARINRCNIYYLLPFFVAIPLPITGGWTASLIAFVFGMPFKKAFLLISLGILIAGLIVLFLTKLGITIEKHFGWQILVGIGLIFGFIYYILKLKNKNNQKNL